MCNEDLLRAEDVNWGEDEDARKAVMVQVRSQLIEKNYGDVIGISIAAKVEGGNRTNRMGITITLANKFSIEELKQQNIPPIPEQLFVTLQGGSTLCLFTDIRAEKMGRYLGMPQGTDVKTEDGILK